MARGKQISKTWRLIMSKVKATKEVRAAHGRTAEERAMFLRNIQNMDHQSVLYVPPEIIPEGMEYRWCNISVMGEPRPGRLIGLRRIGWEVVPPERHPDLVFADPTKGYTTTGSHIERSGLILVERPTEWGEMEEALRAEKDYKNLINLPAIENYMGEPTIPGHNSGYTALERRAPKVASFGE
jgi:hypothetical protein